MTNTFGQRFLPVTTGKRLYRIGTTSIMPVKEETFPGWPPKGAAGLYSSVSDLQQFSGSCLITSLLEIETLILCLILALFTNMGNNIWTGWMAKK